jgi:hypothetical protein
MVQGWYMPWGKRRFHWFEGEGKTLLSLCGKVRASASEVMGTTSAPQAGCVACFQKRHGKAAQQAGGGDRG